MSTFFKPYLGTRPYLFISYAHLQSREVLDTIRILHDRDYRLWYDEGIPAGSDWPANIARHMQDCQAVIYFLSRRAMESPDCYSEIRTAARLGKPILVVKLEDVPVKEEWKPLLDGKPQIPLLESGQERADAILRSGFVSRRMHRSWSERIPWKILGLVASLALFLAAAGVLVNLVRAAQLPEPVVLPTEPTEISETQPTPTVSPDVEQYFALTFPDTQQEQAVRQVLENPDENVYRRNLADITSLTFCGHMVLRDLENVIIAEDGRCLVNGAPVVMGKVEDLSLFSDMIRLETLSLVCQPLGSLAPLNDLVLLKELNLAGSTVEDLGELTNLPSLEILHLEHTGVRDLTPLNDLPNLKIVTVSRDMLPLVWNADADYAVILVS